MSEAGAGPFWGSGKSLHPRIFKIDISKKFDILKRLRFRSGAEKAIDKVEVCNKLKSPWNRMGLLFGN